MSVTITLPQTLEAELESAAEARNSSIEELALAILGHVMANRAPSPEDVADEIRAAPSAKAHPASGSLAEALRDAPEDHDFDLEVWRREWSAVETEMKALSRANALAEGRGYSEA